MNERPGCLAGLLKLFLVDAIFDFFLEKVGFGRGGCCGCGCGVIMLIISTAITCSILLGTDWLKFGF
jgi:hypothetical protein